jgi:hypothetical protein
MEDVESSQELISSQESQDVQVLEVVSTKNFIPKVDLALGVLVRSAKDKVKAQAQANSILRVAAKLVSLLTGLEDLVSEWSGEEWDQKDKLVNSLWKGPMEFLEIIQETGEDLMVDTLIQIDEESARQMGVPPFPIEREKKRKKN